VIARVTSRNAHGVVKPFIVQFLTSIQPRRPATFRNLRRQLHAAHYATRMWSHQEMKVGSNIYCKRAALRTNVENIDVDILKSTKIYAYI
jgi:hypothetical protein